MATTTNYGWTTPDDTDLVKDGAAAIRTLGSSADTTVKNLSPGTTAGDLDYYTSGTAKARLGIGTAAQVLAVNTGATAPEWVTISSGGMTLLASGNLSGSSVSLTSIVQTYKSLQLNIKGIKVTSGSATLNFTVNSNTAANYASCNVQSNAANTVAVQSAATSFNTLQINTSPLSVLTLTIPAYTQSTDAYQYGTFVGHRGSGAVNISGSWSLSTAETAVTSIQINTSASTFSAGSYELYGVK